MVISKEAESFIGYLARNHPKLRKSACAWFGISERGYHNIANRNRRVTSSFIEIISKLEDEYGKSMDFLPEAILESALEKEEPLYCQKIVNFIVYRRDQRETIRYFKKFWKVEENRIRNFGVLIAHNGWGKTLTAMGVLIEKRKENPKVQIIYFCKTHAQISGVISYMERIGLNGISIRARSDLCFQDIGTDPIQNAIICRKKRTKKAIKNGTQCKFFFKKKEEHDVFNLSSDKLIEYCKNEGICPYFSSREHVFNADIIFLCYAQLFNRHIFSSFVKGLRGYDKEKKSLNNTIFVFDECHNLVNFSGFVDVISLNISNAYVSDDRFHELKFSTREIADFHRNVRYEILKIKEFFKLNRMDEIEIPTDKRKKIRDDVCKRINIDEIEFTARLELSRIKGAEFKENHDFVAFFKNFFNFDEVFEINNYFSIKLDDNGKPILFQANIRYDWLISPAINSLCLFMSGTLLVDQLQQVLRIQEVLLREFHYTFPIGNRKIYVCKELSSAHSIRSPDLYRQYGDVIARVLGSLNKKGAIFFPSYKFRANILKYSGDLRLFVVRKKARLFFEEQGKSSVWNDDLVMRFRKSNKGVLFGIAGGRNSEGLDFKDSQLKFILIAGLAIPRPTPFRDRLAKEWGFERVFYRPAGMITAQAIGRAIRDKDQKAMIVVLDNRFKNKAFLKAVPKDLENFEVISTRQLGEKLMQFRIGRMWDEKSGSKNDGE